jgi:hypothetical protein
MLRVLGPLLVAGLFLCPEVRPQDGAYTAQADLDHLVQAAQTIVRGHVVSLRIEHHPQFSNLETVVITLSVSKTLKGDAASSFTFRQLLWDVRDTSTLAGYKGSGEVLLFLNPVSHYGLTSPVGLEQGRFRILRDAKGNKYALNGRGNLGLFSNVIDKAGNRGLTLSKPLREMLSKPGGQAPLDSFEATIQALVGAPK